MPEISRMDILDLLQEIIPIHEKYLDFDQLIYDTKKIFQSQLSDERLENMEDYFHNFTIEKYRQEHPKDFSVYGMDDQYENITGKIADEIYENIFDRKDVNEEEIKEKIHMFLNEYIGRRAMTLKLKTLFSLVGIESIEGFRDYQDSQSHHGQFRIL